VCVYVCLLLQDLLHSCSRGGRETVEDLCYERRRTETGDLEWQPLGVERVGAGQADARLERGGCRLVLEEVSPERPLSLSYQKTKS
jgi:hypothetical protein